MPGQQGLGCQKGVAKAADRTCHCCESNCKRRFRCGRSVDKGAPAVIVVCSRGIVVTEIWRISPAVDGTSQHR